QTKESTLRVHLVPWFGKKKLDQIGYAQIQDYTADKTKRLGKKTVNNHLTMLRRLLVLARKRRLLAPVPEIEWLQAPQPDFVVCAFEEADRLMSGADEAWPSDDPRRSPDGHAPERASRAPVGGRRSRRGAGQRPAGGGPRHHWDAEEWKAKTPPA